MDTSIPRPLAYLREVKKKYPLAIEQIDKFRASRKELGDWPQWCFCPLAGSYAVVSNTENFLNLDSLHDIGTVGAVIAWRATQGIYRFDQTVYEAVIQTDLKGDIPVQVLHQLPEWCVYIETPGAKAYGGRIHGFFAHLEYDVNDSRSELRLMLDSDDGLLTVPLHLGSDIHSAIERATREASKQFIKEFTQKPNFGAIAKAEEIAPFVSLLLYLCSQAVEIRDQKGSSRQPKFPKATKLKSGFKILPANQVTTWEVAYRLGSALRLAETQQSESEASGTHNSPKPHVRRAHWHTFLTGPRDGERKPILKWLPPISVNVEAGEIIPTIKRVN